jgi:hypothetical protein
LFLAGATATSSSLDSRFNPYLGYLLIVRGKMHAVCTVLDLGTVASRARKLVSRQSKWYLSQEGSRCYYRGQVRKCFKCRGLRENTQKSIEWGNSANFNFWGI